MAISEVREKPSGCDLRGGIADTDADLTELRGDASALVDERELPTGEYASLQ